MTMLNKCFFLLLSFLTLTACEDNKPTAEKTAITPSATSATPTAVATSAPALTGTAITTATDSMGEKRQIDWAKIDSGEPAVDKNTFNYRITIDSAPVKNYMNAYHVDAKTAQYNLTVGMAVNEPLSKILDQVGTSYVSHELTAGNNSKFIIHTTAKVAPSDHTYIFAEPFAKGLSIPIQIIPDGKK